jgi:glycosyltransferase involved in cell wall biosynthesis
MRAPTRSVSIVIPAYNYGQYLGEAIDSALAQTQPPLEVIVVDDGSTDNTAAVAQSYGNAVRYIHKDNSGPSAARNVGVRSARGQLVVFLDADNKLAPTYIAETCAALTAHPDWSFVYTQLGYFEASAGQTAFPQYDVPTLLKRNFIDACALVERDAVLRYPYDERLRLWEDWDFYLTLAEHGLRGGLLNKPLLLYRKHNEQDSALDLFSLRQQRKVLWYLRRRHWRLYGLLELLRFGLWYARASRQK